MDTDPTAGEAGWTDHRDQRGTNADQYFADQRRQTVFDRIATTTPFALIGLAITATIGAIIQRSRGKRR